MINIKRLYSSSVIIAITTLTLLCSCQDRSSTPSKPITAVSTIPAANATEATAPAARANVGQITPSEIEWQKFMMAQEKYSTTELKWNVLISGQYGEYVIGYVDGNRNFKVALTGPYPQTYKEAVHNKLLPQVKDNDMVTVQGLFYHGVTSFPLVVVNSIGPLSPTK